MGKATREFKVEKIGDTYVTVPVDHYPNATRTTYGMWGFVLAMLGLSRRGWPAVLLTTVGGLMVCRAVTGRGLLPLSWLCCGPRKEPRDARPSLTPSYQHDDRRRAGQMPADWVDEAAMESFPASDPPGRTAKRAVAR